MKNMEHSKNQHYIPQTYLKGFSNDKKNIYSYDLTGKKVFNNAVPIRTICYKKDLYEYKNQKDEIVLDNYNEKVLGNIESMFSNNKKILLSKLSIEHNFDISHFFSKEEKKFWLAYLTIQFFRNPTSINACREYIDECFRDEAYEYQKENLAIKKCLPFIEKMSEDNKECMEFNAVLKPMLNMGFLVGVSDSVEYITSDNPVILCSNEFPCDEYEIVIFPITSYVCLYLINQTIIKHYGKKNFAIHIKENSVINTNYNIAANSNRFIYSEKTISDNVLRLYQEVHNNKDTFDLEI